MLYRLLERLKRSRRIDLICLVTSTVSQDDVLVKIAREAEIQAYRGPLDDVLTRVIGAARMTGADLIVDITGDCPLVDPEIVDAVIARYLEGNYDYVTNVLDELTFPVGFDVQVFPAVLLKEVGQLTSDPQHREDVTSFFYHNPQRYRLLNLRAPVELHRPYYRLCVDYEQDYDVVTAIYGTLYRSAPAFDAWKIVEFLDRNPGLVAKNNWMEDAFVCPSSGGLAHQEFLGLARIEHA